MSISATTRPSSPASSCRPSQLNNLLSNVPLLGPLLTGGKDGGLFAVSYQLSGPLDDLKTDVNMMSAMTPGALRELFISQPDSA